MDKKQEKLLREIIKKEIRLVLSEKVDYEGIGYLTDTFKDLDKKLNYFTKYAKNNGTSLLYHELLLNFHKAYVSYVKWREIYESVENEN